MHFLNQGTTLAISIGVNTLPAEEKPLSSSSSNSVRNRTLALRPIHTHTASPQNPKNAQKIPRYEAKSTSASSRFFEAGFSTCSTAFLASLVHSHQCGSNVGGNPCNLGTDCSSLMQLVDPTHWQVQGMIAERGLRLCVIVKSRCAHILCDCCVLLAMTIEAVRFGAMFRFTVSRPASCMTARAALRTCASM